MRLSKKTTPGFVTPPPPWKVGADLRRPSIDLPNLVTSIPTEKGRALTALLRLPVHRRIKLAKRAVEWQVAAVYANHEIVSLRCFVGAGFYFCFRRAW